MAQAIRSESTVATTSPAASLRLVLAPARRAGAEARRAHRVLVVDDGASIRLLCSLNLRDAGFEVIEAEDGRRGLEHAFAHAPDVVLSDVEMPLVDGYELALALARDERTRAIPLVFMSGRVPAPDDERTCELRAADFVAKPFDPTLLAPLLSSVIDRAAVTRPGGAETRSPRPASACPPRTGSSR